MTTEPHLDAVRAYAATVTGRRPDVVDVHRFDDGHRHHVYKVSLDAPPDLVVRVALEDNAIERAQAQREAAVLDVLGGRAAPPLLDFRLTSAWFDAPAMCTSFVPGHPLALEAGTPAQLERLGAVVAHVHDHPVGDLSDHLGPIVELDTYAATRLQSILEGLVWLREPVEVDVRARLTEVARDLERAWDRRRPALGFDGDEPLALLHGDIAEGNVLWGPDPVLIDWEYVRWGDPADEIAYLCDQNVLPEPQRTAFWRGYAAASDRPPGRVRDRTTWWEPLTLLGSTLWWVERWVRRTEADAGDAVDPVAPRDAASYLEQVRRRLARLDRR